MATKSQHRSQIPETIRAWTFANRTRPEPAFTLQTLPAPSPNDLKPEEVLIKITHFSLFVPFKNLMTNIAYLTSTKWVPENLFAGVIVAAGSEVQDLKCGDEVFGAEDRAVYFKHGGVAAEFITIPSACVALRPHGISREEASGLGANGCTVVQFAEVTKMKSGDKVLITGAGTATGMAMVQIAKNVVGDTGLVVGTSKETRKKQLSKLGVDELLDYTQTPSLPQYLEDNHSSQPFDVIIDIAGTHEDLYDRSPRYLTPEGTFLFAGKIDVTHDSKQSTILNVLRFVLRTQFKCHWPLVLGGTPRKAVFHTGRINKEFLNNVRKLMEEGQLRGTVDSVWEMDDLLAAYERTTNANGRVVVHVQD